MTASFLATALVVGGVGAWHLLRGNATPQVKKMFSMAMWMAALVAPIQIFIGDQHGLNTLEHQPAKILAIEGDYLSHADGAPLYLFGLPNDRTQQLDYAVGIPHLGSLILKHDRTRRSPGSTPSPTTSSRRRRSCSGRFRLMVGLGFADVRARPAEPVGALARARSTARACCTASRWSMSPMGFVAIIAGWVTTEVGRQPFLVYGLLRTSRSMSPLGAPAVATSLIAFVVIYFAVFGVGIWYILRLMHAPPHPGERDARGRARRSAAAGITPAAQDPHPEDAP